MIPGMRKPGGREPDPGRKPNVEGRIVSSTTGVSSTAWVCSSAEVEDCADSEIRLPSEYSRALSRSVQSAIGTFHTNFPVFVNFNCLAADDLAREA